MQCRREVLRQKSLGYTNVYRNGSLVGSDDVFEDNAQLAQEYDPTYVGVERSPYLSWSLVARYPNPSRGITHGMLENMYNTARTQSMQPDLRIVTPSMLALEQERLNNNDNL